MAFPVPPNDPNTPIPNDPFYYPQQNNLQSDFGPLIIGTGLNIDYATGILTANDPGTPAGVTALMAGDGIFLNANTGIVTVTNSGVTSIVGGTGIGVTNVGGTFTISNLVSGGGNGTVTQINTGGGLTGGPITSVGTIALTQTGVAAATYANPTITVDEYGRITFAAPGSVNGYPVQATYPLQSDGLLPSTISIAAASTTARGSVQLNDTVTSTSTIEAATPRAVKQAYDTATTASANSTSALNLATTANSNASTALSSATLAQTQAGTALSCATVAQNTADSAATAAATADSKATSAYVLANTANNTATTACTSASVRIPCTSFVNPGDILVATGSGTFVNLGVGNNGYVLAACDVCTGGVFWENIGTIGAGSVTQINTGTGLVGGPITTVGVIALDTTGVIAGCYVNPTIEVNAEGQIVSATGGTTVISGITANAPLTAIGSPVVDLSVAYATSTTSGVVCLHNSLTSTSPLLALTAQQGKCLQDQLIAVCADKISSISATSPLNATTGINPTISIDAGSTSAPGAVQLYDGVDSTSTALALTANQGKNLQDQINAIPANTAIPCSTLLAKGSLVTATSPGTPVNLSAGSDGEVLIACAACTEGLAWTPAITSQDFGAKGDLLVGLGVETFCALAVPTVAGCVLTSSPSQSTGMIWATPAAPNPTFASLINDSNVALTPAGITSSITLPFSQSVEAVGIDWDISDPTNVCILSSGVYSWSLNVSYCWDGTAPDPIEASVAPLSNGFTVSSGPFTSGAYSATNTGFTSMSYSGMSPLNAGDKLSFFFELNHTGCLYSPGAAAGGSTRVALNVLKLNSF
jgi:hypothetical protein